MSSVVSKTEHLYIVCDEEILGGEPIIAGTRTPVRAVAEYWKFGLFPEEIAARLTYLSLAQIFDALSYYCDHQEEIEAYILRNRIPEELIDERLR